jgi:hypothetical protein
MTAASQKPGCVDPRLGTDATLALGRTPTAAVEAHRAVCRTCALELLGFESLGEFAVHAPAALRARLSTLARSP